jgi:hypothetical protein
MENGDVNEEEMAAFGVSGGGWRWHVSTIRLFLFGDVWTHARAAPWRRGSLRAGL